jgi:polysaccharide deacetylase family protein (PEP-CTERM system associated)
MNGRRDIGSRNPTVWGTRMLNVLSVDVEDYHDQLALDFQGRIVPPNEEAVRATDKLLGLFADFKVKATFFILGEIAEFFPSLVRRIADGGHHLGVHGYHHHLVHRLTEGQFRDYTERAKKLIEDVSGRSANAYRATAFSINASTPWAIPTLIDLGFKYDSSVYPFKGRRYGDSTAPRHPYRRTIPDGRWIWEIPLSTVAIFGRRWPVCGGGYLRHFPLSISDWAIRRLNAEGIGAVMYLHPYEVEPSPEIQALPDMSFLQRCRFNFFNYHQLRRRSHTIPALRYLLGKHHFGTIEEAIAAGSGSSNTAASTRPA